MDQSSSTLLINRRKSSSSPTRIPPKQKRKSTTTTTTNKPIKVRYISNPMRVETCPSKFRELVQELTGQDAADLPQEPTTFPVEENLHRPCESSEMNSEPLDGGGIREYYSPMDDDEVFNAPQMSASLSGFFSSGFYNVNALGSIGSL
ncbi:PREDICTED: sigma factor binding protein 2, chloroplastic-like [Camelina sativa]|uniref:Sigma factor binding protein 2, chloroplastic-like n=1 Tax=Camelina sativa TaxID=90675 RepID=A0ABM0ZLY7_CAMSA|nr:PREDICTED: sigma factor binding protein 2, chloroplastic-like [Camelina sativa]